MQTPIDFGKNFIYSLYRQRDAAKAAECLSDDIVWVTPDEIFHLKTKKEVSDFIEALLRQDPNPYNVDIVSIRSALVPGDTNTVVYNVNLIPRKEQETRNLRCSLSIHRERSGYRLTFVGMSRKYVPSYEDQVRGFIENIPAGLIVLAGSGTEEKVFRELYANSCFAENLGISDDEFYDRSETNPFFMFPTKEQQALRSCCTELSNAENPGIVSMPVTLITLSGDRIPCQATIKAAYRDREGTRTILYLLFHDVASVLRKVEEKYEKEKADLTKSREEEIRRRLESLDEEAARVSREAEEERSEAQKKIEETGKLIRAAEEAVKLAHAEADARVDEAARKAREEALREADAAKEEAQKKEQDADDRVKQAEEEARQAKERTKEAEKKIRQAREQLEELEDRKRESDDAYEARIRDLQKAIKDKDKEKEQALDEERAKLDLAYQDKAESIRKAARQREDALNDQILQERADRKEDERTHATEVERLKEEIRQKELGIRKQDTDNRIREKEKAKAVDRIRWLLTGQMNAIQSLSAEAGKETTGKRQKQILERTASLSQAVPGMIEDLNEIAKIDPSGRTIEEAPFLLSDCLGTVRKVIRPQCREKGIIFSCETNGTVPDRVVGSKAGLQLAFLGILENAVHSTASGGRIILTAVADAPVRDRAYFHFTISDTGSGIPDDRLPSLFDDPTGELSIARKVISSMGGSIQVRSSYGSGSRFEISVNLQLGSRDA